MTKNNLSTTTPMFLWAGFMKCGGLTNEEEGRYAGEIGAARMVRFWADRLDVALRMAADSGFENPGVFDYEVTEPVGEFLRKQGCADDEATRYVVAVNIVDFFGPQSGVVNPFAFRKQILDSWQESAGKVCVPNI